jgi:hypothetical protein
MEAFRDFCWRWLHSLVGAADEPEPAHATSIAMKNAEGEPSSAAGARGRSPEPAHSA